MSVIEINVQLVRLSACCCRCSMVWLRCCLRYGLRWGQDHPPGPVQDQVMGWDIFWPIVNTHTHPFNGPFSGTTQLSRYQKGKTNLDFTEARDSEWQWHQLGHMQVCTSLQADNSARTPPLSFLQAGCGCPSCHPTNSVKALKACSGPL